MCSTVLQFFDKMKMIHACVCVWVWGGALYCVGGDCTVCVEIVLCVCGGDCTVWVVCGDCTVCAVFIIPP